MEPFVQMAQDFIPKIALGRVSWFRIVLDCFLSAAKPGFQFLYIPKIYAAEFGMDRFAVVVVETIVSDD
jgi:hypothetical protein